MLTLYEHPLSPYAQKVKIALREKGLAFDARIPSGVGSGETGDLAFAAGNPRGEVPLLIGEDGPLFDSTIILEYLEDRYPDPALLPGGAIERARARTLEEVFDTHYEAITWGLSEVLFFERATGELAAELQAAAAGQLERLHSWLGEQLGSGVWLAGDDFGWADLCAAPFVNAAAGFGLGPAGDTVLTDWLARANARPSVAATAEEAAAAMVGMSEVGRIVAAGLFKRQYRDHRLEWMVRSGGLEIVSEGLAQGNIRFTEFP
jgi:glutathione S-transferase/RNA polymerase-associated protein